MTSDRSAVAIVGGGASGTILAATLARRGIGSVLIDGSGRAGHGIAYSTQEPAHLLNVRAEGMSAWADDPDHFAQRFEAEGGDRRGFAQRRLFGAYLREILENAVDAGHTRVIHATAAQASRSDGAWSIQLDDGQTVQADALVVASGNQEPEPLPFARGAGHRYVANPWGEDARRAVASAVEKGGDVLLIGTGLTMVDAVLSLESAGHRGRIVALSRRGQIPRGHADFEAAPVEADQVPHGDLIALLRWLRRRSAEVGWRAAIDSLRPHSHALWQGLSPERQRRFLRHARPWWDVHRHRIAPEVAATIARLIGEGRLDVMAGRIISIEDCGDSLEVTMRKRGSAHPRTMQFACAINCTGPLHSMLRTRDPLLRSLLDRGEVHADHLGIGLAVDENSRAGERLWALGPLTKGLYWEIIAVPDIRVQAAAVADDIAAELD
jgi:uncharacterized NAD(P)/FAD-binding protein YdhS